MIDWNLIPLNVFKVLDRNVIVLKVSDVMAKPHKTVSDILEYRDKIVIRGYANRNKFNAYEIIRKKPGFGYVIGYNYVYLPFSKDVSDFNIVGFVQTIVVFADSNDNIFILNKMFKNVEIMKTDDYYGSYNSSVDGYDDGDGNEKGIGIRQDKKRRRVLKKS